MDDKSSKFKRGELLRLKMSAYGAKGLSEIEILEYLLTLDSPSKDCSKFANYLMNRYISLSEIFESDEIELHETCGISDSKSLLLTTIPSIYRVYQKAKSKDITIRRYDVLFNLVIDIMNTNPKASPIVFCFDERLGYIDCIDEYNIDIPANVWAKDAIRLGTEYIAIGFRLDNDFLSIEDITYITESFIDTFDVLNMQMIDAIIIRNGKTFSLIDRVRDLIDNRKPVTDIENGLALRIYPLKDDEPISNNTKDSKDYFDFENEIFRTTKKHK